MVSYAGGNPAWDTINSGPKKTSVMGADFDPYAVQVPVTIAPDFKALAKEILDHKDKMATRGDWNERVIDYCNYASQAFSIINFASFFGKTPTDLQTAFGLVSSGFGVFTAFEDACHRINRYTRGNWSRATLQGDTKIYIANPYLRASLEAAPSEIPYNTIAYFKRRSARQTAGSLAALCSIFLRCKTVVDVAALTTSLASLTSSSIKHYKLGKIDLGEASGQEAASGGAGSQAPAGRPSLAAIKPSASGANNDMQLSDALKVEVVPSVRTVLRA
ncbi:hypothetical protein [Brytella acorum]|uniref:Uncharacterized protein n=1 Tax=Brytella acorum TaxID=2959299 RepID=A0AA35VC63_9PROT|nr:hypothetical protein [Brytella acorum]CAI9121524.1 hypothetical protein LMG32879_002371 [Brytella acorum]